MLNIENFHFLVKTSIQKKTLPLSVESNDRTPLATNLKILSLSFLSLLNFAFTKFCKTLDGKKAQHMKNGQIKVDIR
jgi:hypothetical protein